MSLGYQREVRPVNDNFVRLLPTNERPFPLINDLWFIIFVFFFFLISFRVKFALELVSCAHTVLHVFLTFWEISHFGQKKKKRKNQRICFFNFFYFLFYLSAPPFKKFCRTVFRCLFVLLIKYGVLGRSSIGL